MGKKLEDLDRTQLVDMRTRLEQERDGLLETADRKSKRIEKLNTEIGKRNGND